LTGTVLVTGATGYLGSRLVSALVEEDYDVHVLVRASSYLDRLDSCLSRIEIHVDDGTTKGLATSIGDLGIDVCFHLAAHCLARHTAADVAPLIESNIAFPTRLAEALASERAPIFVNTGTVWQHVKGRPYRPSALYAATKQAFEDVLRWYAEEGKLRVITLVLYDTYGPRDTRGKFIDLLRGASAEGRELATSPGEQLIDLTYVDDVVQAFLMAPMVAEKEGEPFLRYSVASRAPLSLRSLVEHVERVVGTRIPVRWSALPYRASEMMSYWDAGPTLPGWTPRIGLEEGIARTWNQ
jgi:nucleoside-diphosphate-sugar epimerase